VPIRAKEQTSPLLEVLTIQGPACQTRGRIASVEPNDERSLPESSGLAGRGRKRKSPELAEGVTTKEADTGRGSEEFRGNRETTVTVANALLVHVGPITVGNNLSAIRAACRFDMYHDAFAGSFQIDRPPPNLVPGEPVYVADESHAPAARSGRIPSELD
jgi:hypothetical protein